MDCSNFVFLYFVFLCLCISILNRYKYTKYYTLDLDMKSLVHHQTYLYVSESNIVLTDILRLKTGWNLDKDEGEILQVVKPG